MPRDTTPVGVSLPEELHEEIVASMDAGELNKSERMRELIERGLALESVAADLDASLPDERRPLESTLRQWILDSRRRDG